MAENENYGKKFDYDPLWSGPIGKVRSPTDIKFFKSLCIFCIIWIGISTYAFLNGSISRVVYGYTDTHSRVSRSIHDEISQSPKLSKGSIVTILIGMSVAVCFSYIIVLSWFTKLLIWTLIYLFFIVLLVSIQMTFIIYVEYKTSEILFLTLLFAIIFLVSVFIILYLRKKINIACEAIKESCKAVIFFPSSLFFPILPAVLYTLVISFTVSVHLSLRTIVSAGDETPFHITIFQGINVFGFLWVGSFVGAFSRMVLSGTFATWYWTLNKNQVPNYTLIHFVKTTTKYHLGTLAFGSLIIAICNVIKMLLNFIKRRLQGRCNPFAFLCFCWYQRLFGILEKIIEYISYNAYIMCAIHGTTFIQSAKDAFNLLMRNIVKVFVIKKVTNIILFIGQIFTIGLPTLGAYKLCEYNLIQDIELGIVLTIVFFASLLVTVSFFMALKTAIDTVFLCVLEDYERNDGSNEKPYYMSLKLKNLLLQE